MKRLMLISVLSLMIATSGSAQQLEQVVEELARQISESLVAQEKKKVAILPLTDLAGSRTPFGQLLAEELTNQLFVRRGDRFEVVERTKIESIWQEQSMAASGLLTSDAVAGIGALVGADAILTGSVAELDDRLRVNARLMAVPSGKLFATASTFMLKTGLGRELLRPEGDSGGGGASGSPAARPASQTVKNVTFDLLACEKQVRLIVCKIVAVNNDVDRDFEIRAYSNYSSLYDQAGRIFSGSIAKVANMEGAGASIRLITEVPTAIEVHFQGVPSTIEFIKVLSFWTNLGQVEFRDIRF